MNPPNLKKKTVVNPLRKDYIAKTAENPQFALNTVFEQKWKKYGPDCESQGLVFHPLPAITLGAWYPLALEEIKKLGTAMARATNQEEKETTRHLLQRLSILLMKGNTALLISRIPSPNNPSITGDL